MLASRPLPCSPRQPPTVHPSIEDAHFSRWRRRCHRCSTVAPPHQDRAYGYRNHAVPCQGRDDRSHRRDCGLGRCIRCRGARARRADGEPRTRDPSTHRSAARTRSSHDYIVPRAQRTPADRGTRNREPGAVDRRNGRRCKSMPPRTRPCWRLLAVAGAPTTSPTTMARCRSRKRAPSSASIRLSGCSRDQPVLAWTWPTL